MTHFIKPCEGRLTSPFGWRTHPITGKKDGHQGVDFAQSGNVKILASAGGEVIRVGLLGSYGYVVMIRHTINGKRMDTNYAHLKSNILVGKGDIVKQGDHIAWMGNTGSSTGQHLHFEIHDGAWATGQPNAVDPMKYITEKKVEEVKPVVKPVEKTRFSDVSKGHSAYEALEALFELGVIKGHTDGTYKPNEPLTRAHHAITLYRLVKALKG